MTPYEQLGEIITLAEIHRSLRGDTIWDDKTSQGVDAALRVLQAIPRPTMTVVGERFLNELAALTRVLDDAIRETDQYRRTRRGVELYEKMTRMKRDLPMLSTEEAEQVKPLLVLQARRLLKELFDAEVDDTTLEENLNA